MSASPLPPSARKQVSLQARAQRLTSLEGGRCQSLVSLGGCAQPGWTPDMQLSCRQLSTA